MRYVTHYEEYPIYEPAEGGYYYSGNQVVDTERMSKRKAKGIRCLFPGSANVSIAADK